MPRRSSSGGFSSRSSSSSRGNSTPARKPAPKPVATPPPRAPGPAPAQAAPVSSGSTIGGAIADGVGWGFGSSIGRRVADAVMGPPVVKHETVASDAGEKTAPSSAQGLDSLACAAPIKAFQDCLDSNVSDISKCQFLMDRLSECRSRDSASPINV